MRQPRRLLFVCTANICRSPMAEGLTRDYAAKNLLSIECASAGVRAPRDRSAARNAIRVLNAKGIDLRPHLSKPVTRARVDWADHILVMEMRHARTLRKQYPDAEDKVLQLASFGGLTEIADPVGGWRWRFRRCRDDLQRCIESFLSSL